MIRNALITAALLYVFFQFFVVPEMEKIATKCKSDCNCS